jgi:hypothetical protein
LLATRKENYAKARTELQQAAEKYPKQPAFALALAALTARQGDDAGAKAELDAAEKKFGALVELDVARLQLEPTLAGARTAGTLRHVTEHLGRFGEADRRRLLAGLAERHVAWKDLAGARGFWWKLKEELPRDFGVRLQLFEIAGRQGDADLGELMAKEIKLIEGAEGPFSHYIEARRLLALAERAGSAKEREPELHRARAHLNAAE